MSYEVFQERVNSLLDRVGLSSSISVRFSHEDGRHRAQCSDGTLFTGNAQTVKVMVHWGSGHSAITSI